MLRKDQVAKQYLRKAIQWRVQRIIKKLIVKDFAPHNFLHFTDVQKAVEWGIIAYQDWTKKLATENENIYFDKSERYLKTSSQAIAWYCGYWYDKVNEPLRFELEFGFERLCNEIIFYLDSEFDSSRLKENIVVIRWINQKVFRRIFGTTSEGSELNDKGYMSTSLHLGYISDLETGERNIENDVLLIIKIPKGTKCLYMYPIVERYSEQEVLLPRGTTLTVDRVYRRFFRKSILLCSVKSQASDSEACIS